MSLVGQVDWYFQVTVCARETCGMAIAAAPVAPAVRTNLRRVVDLEVADLLVDMGVALPGGWNWLVQPFRPLCSTNRRYSLCIPAELDASLNRPGIDSQASWSARNPEEDVHSTRATWGYVPVSAEADACRTRAACRCPRFPRCSSVDGRPSPQALRPRAAADEVVP